MPRILLVKTSSLGDLVHNLPVASDIASVVPGAEIDWVAEESMAAVPALHGSVRTVIPVAIRRWRANAWRRATWREIRDWIERLRSQRYDAIVDTQGLLKSALIARAARGPRYGFDWRTSREPLAVFYDRTFHVPRHIHAVERNRILAAAALRYEKPAAVEYRIRAEAGAARLVDGDYVMLLHATSARAKLWPEARWTELGRVLLQSGLRSVLPWGSEEEHARSRRLADSIAGAVVPARMLLGELASLLAGARYAVGVDTGLTHLAGALGVATVGLYIATDPSRTGLRCARGVNLGGPGEMPQVQDVLQRLRTLDE
jgi:heptosyltransferase I